jgi:hypothetical protein
MLWAAGATAATAQPILNRLEKVVRDQLGGAAAAEQRQPGYLGLIGDDQQDAGRGVRVLEVFPDGPAAKGGVQAGDLIVGIDGREIRALDDVAQALDGKHEGDKLAITVARNAERRQQSVTLGRRSPAGQPPTEQPPQSAPASAPVEDLPAPGPSPQPAAPPAAAPAATPSAAGRPRLGVRSVPVSEAARQANSMPTARGALVIAVAAGSPAERAGIPVGAIVTEVGATVVNTPEELAAAVRAESGNFELSYVHQGITQRRRVTLDAQGEGPVVELRNRPPQPANSPANPPADLPAATPTAPPRPQPGPPPRADVELPAANPPSAEMRIEMLERTIQRLQERVETLEAQLARLRAEAAPK